MMPTLQDIIPADLEERHALMAAVLRASIAHQVRMLRMTRKIDRLQLAEGLKISLAKVVDLEDPEGAWPTVELLRKIAVFFDVALLVRFQDWPSWAANMIGYLPPPSWGRDSVQSSEGGEP